MRAFLVVLAVLGVLVVGGVVALGFSRDWFHLTVNEDKMRADTDEAKEKVQAVGKQIKDKAGDAVDQAKEGTAKKGPGIKTATGRVKKVEAADNRFLMTTADSTELTVHMDPSSTLRLNDQQVGLEDLRIGDEARVDYDLKEGQALAGSVTVNRN
jgi:hypothetical protein